MVERNKNNITHTVRYDSLTFWLIVGEQTLGSLQYSLIKLINQKYEKDKIESDIENDLIIEEYDNGPVEIIRTFRNIEDMESFFIMID